MNKKIFLFLSLFLFPLFVNAASDITFSVNQKDYYFVVGDDAIIPLDIDNTYSKGIDGKLTYTYVQEINQGGMHMSSSNSQVISFSAPEGKSTQGLNFGTSTSPSDLKISLQFNFVDNESRVVNLDGITIHFVSNNSQTQNQENKQSSSSQKLSSSQSQNSGQQDPMSQMQQQINQMLGQTQQSSQNKDQALQNSQLNQDSSALKKQIDDQISKQNEMKQEFQKNLAKDSKFQEAHQDLLKQGYNLTGGNFNPSSNNTGDFELNYKKPDGENASLKGRMENGTVDEIQKDTSEDRQNLLNKVYNSSQVQKYQGKLRKDGYTSKNIDISKESDKSFVKLNYLDENNNTASIIATVENDTVQKVELNETKNSKRNNLLLLIIIFILLGVGFWIFKKFHKKPTVEVLKSEKKVEKIFDYKLESNKLLLQSTKSFELKKYKDAYGLAGQALRLFLSYENKLNKEITNDEILTYLRIHKKPYKDIKNCFDLCSLVEFAKYEANSKDYALIVDIVKKVILRR